MRKISLCFVCNIFLLLIITSCVKQVPFPEGNNDLPYALVSFIKNGAPISGSFFKIASIDDAKNEIPDIYKVSLIWDSATIDVVSASKDFEFDEIARAGVTYKIEVYVNNDTIWSSATVPDYHEIKKVNYLIGNIKSAYAEPVMETSVSALSHGQNYFELKYFYGDLTDSDANIEPFTVADLMPVTNPDLLSEGYLDFNPFTFILNTSDSLLNIDLNYICQSYEFNGSQYTPSPAFAVVRSITYDYYLFVKSLIKHNYNQNSTTSSGSSEWDFYSFFKKGEPVELYTNVKGGVGIVAAYSETLNTFELAK